MPEDLKKPQEGEPQNQSPQSGEQNQSPQGGIDIEAEVRKRLDEFAKSLGFENADEMQMKILEEAGRYEELKEKLQKEAQMWRQKYQESILRSEITTKAAQMGVVDTDLLMTLVKEKAQITEGQVLVNGKPLEEFLNELKKEKPYLFQQPRGGSGASHSGIQTNPDLAKLSPEERLRLIAAKKFGG